MSITMTLLFYGLPLQLLYTFDVTSIINTINADINDDTEPLYLLNYVDTRELCEFQRKYQDYYYYTNGRNGKYKKNIKIRKDDMLPLDIIHRNNKKYIEFRHEANIMQSWRDITQYINSNYESIHIYIGSEFNDNLLDSSNIYIGQLLPATMTLDSIKNINININIDEYKKILQFCNIDYVDPVLYSVPQNIIYF